MSILRDRLSETMMDPTDQCQPMPARQNSDTPEKGGASVAHRSASPAEMTEAEAARVTTNLVELLGTVSHELRSPLAAIKGYAATLLRNGQRLPPKEQREFVETIHQASERMEAVIDRLMEMAQLEVAAPELTYHRLNFASLAQASVDHAERSIRMSGRILSLTLDMSQISSTSALVLGDERRLRIVLDHVLENAINYTPDGGSISVTLTSPRADTAPVDPRKAPVAEGATLFELAVHDSGRGIPPEDLLRIFERFHRVDMRLTREVDGLGLGLAICKRIVELHGGSIWAESAVGVGSTFHVLLPGTEADANGDI
ncbi:MAG TPA: HAMP domain-containing sensor histidine kinase [Ktedonobacterales bacterium]